MLIKRNHIFMYAYRKIFIPDIDVTVPFFIIEKSGFQNGVEIVWSQSNPSGELKFNIHKFKTI